MRTNKENKLHKIIEEVEKRGISAYELAKKTKLSEAGIGKILNKVSINPRITTVDLLYDYLFSKDHESNMSLTNTNGNIFTFKSDGNLNVRVRLVPFEAFASYIEGVNDTSIVNEWEEVTFDVSKYGRGNYMAFRIKGDSMNGGKINDTPDKSLILGRELGRHNWLDGFNPTKYGWIILSKTNIFHKDIIDFNKSDGTIVCHSRNESPEFSNFTLHLNDVFQIFKVIKRTF